MRILHIIPYFYPAWAYGGTCRAAWELARALVRHGQEVVVYTTDALDANKRATPAYEVVDGVEIHRFRNLSNHLAWGRVFLPLAIGQALKKSLPSVDVAHLHEYRSYQNAVALPMLRKHGVPFVLTAQGGMPKIMGRYLLKVVYDALVGQQILNHACRLHALNSMEHGQFVNLNVDPARIAVLPNGVDIDEYRVLPAETHFRQRFNIPTDAPLVLFLARVNRIKGVDFLVEAFAQVRRRLPEAYLAVVGPDDGYLPEIKRQVQALGLADRVRFTGYLDGVDKLMAYQAADVYVLPSAYEMFAITLLESLACGTPIIATDRCGLADYVRENELGRIVTYRNVDDLTDEIVAILEDRVAARTRAVSGRDHVLANFGWEYIAQNWLDVYETCRQNRGR